MQKQDSTEPKPGRETDVKEEKHINKKPRTDVRLEPSLFLRKPMDDTLWNLSVFLSRSIDACVSKNIENSQIEIEGRLGKILQKKNNERVKDYTLSESIFAFNSNYYFDPNMSMAQHSAFNQILNHATTSNTNIKYQHLKTMDSFYGGLRVTKDLETSQETCIKKIKVSEMHIRSPNCEFDIRISVNLEVSQQVPQDLRQREPRSIRQKDRLSYHYQVLSVDLTQVTEDQVKIHELEVEFKKTSSLIQQKKLADSNAPNNFCSMVEVLLNTLRMLNRMGKTGPF